MSFSEWKEVKLEEYADSIFSGGTPSTKNASYWNGSFPWLSSGETKNTFIYETEKKITQEGIDNSSTKLAKKDDVVIASAGQGNTRGQTSICKIDTYINQSIISIRSNQKKLNPYYLFYNISSRYKELRKISDGHSIRGSLTTKIIKDLSIKIPPLEEQKAIAHILSTLEDKIEVNNRINKTLEDMAQEIFRQWFVDFEFPNEDGEPYKSSGGEMVESELGMIPKGWEVKKVEKVTKIIRGASPRPIQDFIRDEGIPWVKISDASSSNTRFISSTKEFIKEEGRNKSREVKVGTLILSNSATPGIPMIMKIDACVHDGWLIFDEFREVTKEYMFHFLTENRIGILSLSNGSVFRNLKTDILKNYKIIVPSSNVVARVDDIFKSINNSIDNIENQIITLTQIRDGLLPKLMSGEIRFPLDGEGDAS